MIVLSIFQSPRYAMPMSQTSAINIHLMFEQQQRQQQLQQQQQGQMTSPGASASTYITYSPPPAFPPQRSSPDPSQYPQTLTFNLNPAAKPAGRKQARNSVAQTQVSSTHVPVSVEPQRRATVSVVEVQTQHVQPPPPVSPPPPALVPSQTQTDPTYVPSQTQTEVVVEHVPPERPELQPRAIQTLVTRNSLSDDSESVSAHSTGSASQITPSDSLPETMSGLMIQPRNEGGLGSPPLSPGAEQLKRASVGGSQLSGSTMSSPLQLAPPQSAISDRAFSMERIMAFLHSRRDSDDEWSELSWDASTDGSGYTFDYLDEEHKDHDERDESGHTRVALLREEEITVLLKVGEYIYMSCNFAGKPLQRYVGSG